MSLFYSNGMKDLMKKMTQHTLYPVLITLSLFIAWLFRSDGTIHLGVMFVIIVSANALIWLCELWIPYEKKWKPDRKTLKLDIFYSLSAALVLTPLMKTGLIWLYTKTSWDLVSVWPTQWPVVIQVALGVLTTDFCLYWFHRLCHRGEFGWRIHVVHHTPEKLHFWASARTHPINLFIFYTTEIGLLLFLGMQADVLAMTTIFISINGQFEHCNIDLKVGIFSKFLQTCQTHRIHHSPNWEYSNSNFGNQTVVWDHIFGTYKMVEEPVREVGIKMHSIPENYLTHLKVPFKLRKFKVDNI